MAITVTNLSRNNLDISGVVIRAGQTRTNVPDSGLTRAKQLAQLGLVAYSSTPDTPATKLSQEEVANIQAFVAGTGNSGSSRASLVENAAAGLIPAGVQSISCNYHTTPGDGGGARFIRRTATQMDAYAFTTPAKIRVTFQDASGDWWLLDELFPSLAMVGCFGQSLGVSPSLTVADNCAGPIVGLAEYLFKVFGGGMISYGLRNYYLHSKPLLQKNVGISGPSLLAREPIPLDALGLAAEVDWVPGLVLGAGVTLDILDGFTSSSLCLKRAGILVHQDLAGALDMQVMFNGTGMTKKVGFSARNVSIGQFVAYGFAFGLDADRMHGIRIGDAYGDCLTLIMLRDCGETGVIGESGLVKRKPEITNNAATTVQTVAVTSMFNSGGFVGLNLASNVVSLGLSNNQRCGNSALPAAIVNKRYTVTVLTTTSIQLSAPWDNAYSSFTLTDTSSISFQPGCSSSVVAFYNASGKIGVQSTIPFPFKVGHLAQIGTDGQTTVDGMSPVLTVVSTTNFVLDKAWDAALSSVVLGRCEFGAMPSARYHPSVISYWGSNQGFGAASVRSDGIRVNFANKGGGGFFCSSTSAHIHGSNEGPQAGENDYGPADTVGLHVTEPRTRFTIDSKSCGTAIKIALGSATDSVFGYAIQATDGGRASLDLSTGCATLVGFNTKGLGRIKLSNIGGLEILEGNVQPSALAGNAAADIQRTSLRWRSSTSVHQAAGIWSWWAWNSSGTAVNVLNLSSDAATFLVPVTAPSVVYTSTGGTQGGGAVTVTASDNGCQVLLTQNTSSVFFDATTVTPGFRFIVRNYRPGGAWTVPATANRWGTGVVLRYSLAAAHTKLLASGEATFTVEDITVSGTTTRYLTVRGDTSA